MIEAQKTGSFFTITYAYYMKNNMIIVISALAALFAFLLKSSQIVNWIYSLFGQYQGIFIIDIYIILGIISVGWYAKYMNDKQKEKLEQSNKDTREFLEESLENLHKTVTLEYTSAINNHIEKIVMMVNNTQEDIKEIKENILSLTKSLLDAKN